jgi:hypothetical protein
MQAALPGRFTGRGGDCMGSALSSVIAGKHWAGGCATGLALVDSSGLAAEAADDLVASRFSRGDCDWIR